MPPTTGNTSCRIPQLCLRRSVGSARNNNDKKKICQHLSRIHAPSRSPLAAPRLQLLHLPPVSHLRRLLLSLLVRLSPVLVEERVDTMIPMLVRLHLRSACLRTFASTAAPHPPPPFLPPLGAAWSLPRSPVRTRGSAHAFVHRNCRNEASPSISPAFVLSCSPAASVAMTIIMTTEPPCTFYR